MSADPAAADPPRYSLAWWLSVVGTLVAVTLVAALIVTGALLMITVHDETLWGRHVKLFETLAPLAGGAAGWLFGREVHRKAAADYRRAALAYKGHAQKGRDLARAVKYAAYVAGAAPPGGEGEPATEPASLDASGHLGHLSQLAEEVLSATDAGSGSATDPAR
jgi:hypothetical protein